MTALAVLAALLGLAAYRLERGRRIEAQRIADEALRQGIKAAAHGLAATSKVAELVSEVAEARVLAGTWRGIAQRAYADDPEEWAAIVNNEAGFLARCALERVRLASKLGKGARKP